MAVTIVERPYKCSWSKNDIRYVFQLNNLQRANLCLQVKLKYCAVATNPIPVDLYTFILKPDAAGFVYFYFQQYIDSVLSYVLPDATMPSIFTNANNQMCYYSVDFRELSDGVATPAYDTTESTYTLNSYRLYALKGGIEKHKHSRNNFFLQYNSQRFFLTWQPSDRMIDTTEVVYLSVLNPSYTSLNYNSNYTIRIRMEDVKGGVYVQDIAFDKLCLLYHVRLNVNTLGTGSLFVSDLYKMQVFLLDTVTFVTLAAYNFYFEFSPRYTSYDMIYHNSLSGVDFVRVKGEVEESVERTVEESDAGFDLNSWNNTASGAENIYSHVSQQKKYKGDIGYLRTKGYQYALIELLVSKSIWQRIGWRWVCLITVQKSQELGSRRNYLNSFPIEWALSESNETYTPSDYSLPKGDLT